MRPPPGVSDRVMKLWEAMAPTAYDQSIHEQRPRTMSTESPEGLSIVAPLAHRLNADADVAAIAQAIVAAWQEISLALSPIVGSRGFAALYKRSIYVTGLSHPWLMDLHDNALSTVNLPDLNAVFKLQPRAVAVAGATTLFDTFNDLLVSMVGPSLSERLLRSVWADASSGPSAKDSST